MAVKTKDKPTVTFRISPVAKSQVELLAEHLGLSQTAVLETAIRQLAKKEKIAVPGGSETPQADGDGKAAGNE